MQRLAVETVLQSTAYPAFIQMRINVAPFRFSLWLLLTSYKVPTQRQHSSWGRWAVNQSGSKNQHSNCSCWHRLLSYRPYEFHKKGRLGRQLHKNVRILSIWLPPRLPKTILIGLGWLLLQGHWHGHWLKYRDLGRTGLEDL